MKKINWRWWRPRFEIYIDLSPVLRVQTMLMTDAYDRNAFYYSRIRITIFKRDVLEFNLWKSYR